MVLQLWFVLRLFNGSSIGYFCDLNCEYLKCVQVKCVLQRVICVMHCASSERIQDCADQLRRSNWYVLLN